MSDLRTTVSGFANLHLSPGPGITVSATVAKRFGRPDEEFDEADDRPITDSALPRWLAIGPAGLLFGGFAAILFGAILGAGRIISLGIVSMIAAGVLLLVAAPIVALSAAIRGERRARR